MEPVSLGITTVGENHWLRDTVTEWLDYFGEKWGLDAIYFVDLCEDLEDPQEVAKGHDGTHFNTSHV